MKETEELQLFKSNIEERLKGIFESELIKNPFAKGRRAFHKKNGEVFCIDTLGRNGCLVIEHADSMEDAERLTLEDGGLYYIGDYKNEHECLQAMLSEINDTEYADNYK